MCDEKTDEEADRWLRGRGMTRRAFTASSAAAAVALAVPARALSVRGEDVVVDTADGKADCWFVRPESGEYPGVIVWPDIVGLREAYREMGRRLAEAGYAVLVMNPYYRISPAPVVAPGASFRDPATREILLPMARSLSPASTATDARAALAFLDASGAVDTRHGIGSTGYCMGGSMVFQTAAALPDRVRAGGSFHGGRLVTDADDSPHKVIRGLKGNYLIAVAENDHEREPDHAGILRESFAASAAEGEVEVYEDAMHGWCALDSAVHHPAQAARAHWRLLETFAAGLGEPIA